MSLSKNIKHYRRRILVPITATRRITSGDGANTFETPKMQQECAKTVVLTQWKLLKQLKSCFSKLSGDNIFENALNKEFAQFLQKLQPSVYGNNIIRYFQSSTADPEVKGENKDNQLRTDQLTISLTNVFNSLKVKEKEMEVDKKIEPKWKICKSEMSKESVSSKTGYLLASVFTAGSARIRLTQINELCLHIKSYPEAKHIAVKNGGVRLLLKVRSTDKTQVVQEALGEALSLLGYTDPVTGSGIKLLSIDGGGVRGILVIEMLKKIEELTGKPIHELFDIICGVSTGAIIASLICVKQKTLDQIAEIYKNLSTQIFSQSTIKGTSSLVWSHSYYDTALWEKLLQQELGEECLIGSRRNLKCPKLCAVSAVVNQSHLSAYVFRSYTLPCKIQSQYMGGANHLVWEAVRASAAAPTYFEEFKLGNMLHQDGGILMNNPTAVAIHEAKLLWPYTPFQCVISCGTGRTAPIFADVESASLSNSSWKAKLLAIIDSATDTEGVHTTLSDLLPENVYFRFNPYLTEMLNMAEIDLHKLEQLQRDTVMYLRRNEDKFHEASNALNQTKGITQRIAEWINHNRELHNLYFSKY